MELTEPMALALQAGSSAHYYYEQMIAARPPLPDEVKERIAREVLKSLDAAPEDAWDDALECAGRILSALEGAQP
jgi:hypothetical protein